jgi:hypothetical protein
MPPSNDKNHEEPCVPLKEYIEARFIAQKIAQGAYERDIERRLAELNQLRKEVVEDRGRLVTREMYDQTVREWQLWRDTTNTSITVIETRSVTWTSILGIFFTVVQIGSGVLLYFLLHK